MKINRDYFISKLKDFYFDILKEYFPYLTREKFNGLFDEVIKIGSEE